MLSYDSDFYIFDGQYIPYVTITPKVYKKTVTAKMMEVEIMQKKQKGQKNIRRKPKKIVVETEPEEGEEVKEETYNYLDCCMYKIENLTDGVLENDMLPLFAIMLGNDFIARKWFAKFFRNVSRRPVKKRKNLSPQQKRIYTLLNWLQHETLRSALRKILECVKGYQRQKLWQQIRNAMRGYRMTHSKSFEYFGFEEQPFENADESYVLSMEVDEILASDDEEEDEEVEEEEEAADEEDAEECEAEEEDEDETEALEEEGDGFEIKNSDDDDFVDPNEEPLSDEDEVPVPVARRQKFVFPEWFKSMYNSGATPRFLVDTLRCKRYINYPQVEDFAGPDSNSLSYPILNLLYAVLHSPAVPPMYYYTRVPKQVRYEVKKLEPEIFPVITDFDQTEKKNVRFIKLIFEKYFKNSEEIFELIKTIPEAHQLYFLAVIYWMKRSHHTSSVYLQTVIIGFIALSIVDKKCEKIHRDGPKFVKNFSKHLKELKEKENVAPVEETFALKSAMKNVTKQDALLAMENLINNFSISPKFQRKHADFRRSVVHTFSELQSVVFNLFSLNPLLNYPFENIKIENYFNGLFVYNVYLNLKSRNSPLEYISQHIFQNSPTILRIFTEIYKLCVTCLPDMKHEASDTLDAPRKPKTKTRSKKVKPAPPTDDNDCVEESSDGEFEDLNNKFAQLLRNAN